MQNLFENKEAAYIKKQRSSVLEFPQNVILK